MKEIRLKFDGRINLLSLLITLMLILTYKSYIFNSLVIFLSIFVVWINKLSLKHFMKRLIEPLFIAIILIAIKAGLPLHFHIDGFLQGLQIFLKIIASVSAVSLFFYFTPFHEILHGLKFLKIPQTFIELLLLTGRFILILQSEAERIYIAQKQRLGYTELKKAFKSIAILSVSLITKAFRHTEQTFLAMKQRGYEGEIIIRNKKHLSLGSFIPFYFLFLLVILWLALY